MTYLDVERIQEAGLKAVVEGCVAAVTHRVYLSPALANDAERLYEIFSELYDREAERIADSGKQEAFGALCLAFPILATEAKP
jgi:hypothetical protein